MFIYFHESLISLDDLIFAQALGDDVVLYFRQGGNRICFLNHFAAAKAVQELHCILIEKGYAETGADDLQVELDDDELAALDQAAEDGYQWIARDKNGKIFCYIRKPEKTAIDYLDDHTPDPRRMDPSWYSEIKFETGPVSIDYLRLGG